MKPEEKEKATLDMQESVKKAVEIINQETADVLNNLDPLKQSEIDSIIS